MKTPSAARERCCDDARTDKFKNGSTNVTDAVTVHIHY